MDDELRRYFILFYSILCHLSFYLLDYSKITGMVVFAFGGCISMRLL